MRPARPFRRPDDFQVVLEGQQLLQHVGEQDMVVGQERARRGVSPEHRGQPGTHLGAVRVGGTYPPSAVARSRIDWVPTPP